MFSGIIEETGQVEAFTPGPDAWKLRISARAALVGSALGDSIAVNGCCLTVTRIGADSLEFDVLEETRLRTSLADLAPRAPVNLERSLTVGGKIGGHFVTGHVDGTGGIEVFEPRGRDHYLQVRGPQDCGRYLVRKGSIAIDGISLTVAEVDGDGFAVWLIPTTLGVTNLHRRRVGDRVNLEFDLLGKYVEKLLARPTAEKLSENPK